MIAIWQHLIITSRHLDQGEAMAHIGRYFVGTDILGRILRFEDLTEKSLQLCAFCPNRQERMTIGPWIRTRDLLYSLLKSGHRDLHRALGFS